MWDQGCVVMIDQIDQNVLRGVAPELQRDTSLHLSDAQIGLLLPAFVPLNCLISVPARYPPDRFSPTPTVRHLARPWPRAASPPAHHPRRP